MAKISAEVIVRLKQKLQNLPPRCSERRELIIETAELYGVSEQTIYRMLRNHSHPKFTHRSDRGVPRILGQLEMEQYCELIAAIKVRTSNKKGHHLSTKEAIRLLEDYGFGTPNGLVKAPKSLLKRSTVEMYLRKWGYDQKSINKRVPAVRFEAQYSNECWHFDLSPSDLKHLEKPSWVNENKKKPLLMLYSVVDDKSGVCYQEYHNVYGEDVETALRFLFNAMSPKNNDQFPFRGIPKMIYADNGPISKSHIFLRVMECLGIEFKTHLPKGHDGRRTTARSKGKVERPFCSVKDIHETLYHFHKPETEEEANLWLFNFLIRYSQMTHRTDAHSRMEDWIKNVPSEGLQDACSWERFCTFAREPENRKVGIDSRLSINGICYQVDPELVDVNVIVWFGLFDCAIYVEYGEQRFGPYKPVGDVIPINTYRSFKKTKFEKRADRVDALAEQLSLSKEALSDPPANLETDLMVKNLSSKDFQDPDPFQEIRFPNAVSAKLAISELLGLPLAKISEEERFQIDSILKETLEKNRVILRVSQLFNLSLN